MVQEVTSAPEQADVLVIGAGIIGLLNVLQLAKRGLKVVVVDHIKEEKSYKVGESLLVFSNMFLRTVGGLKEFCRDRSFDKDNLWFTYGMEGCESFHGKTEWALELKVPKQMWDAFETRDRAEVMAHDVHIVRPEAETVMTDLARANPNVTLHDAGRVKDIEWNEQGGPHKVTWQDVRTNEPRVVHAKWVVDCSGRARFLARRLGHAVEDKEMNDEFKTTAVWAQFKGISKEMFDAWEHRFSDGDTMHRHRSTLHLWGKGYWIWVIPLEGGRISVGATFLQKIAPPGTPQEQLWHYIRLYPVLERVLTEENLLEFRMFKNPAHMTDTFVHAKRYGMVGDAGSIIDAYYSQGMSIAFVTSWHMANIIEEDVKRGHLDTEYIDRVNANTREDWHILRNMIRWKYTDAIADPRFFVLSHVLDQVIFTGLLQERHWLARWLFETGGDTSKETEEHKELRRALSKSLFYCRGGLLGRLMSGRAVRKLQGHWQKKLAERALLRLENGVTLPKARALLRFPNRGIELSRLTRSVAQQFIELSPERMPARGIEHIKYNGTEKKILLTRIMPVLVLSRFLGAYKDDVVDTELLKKKLKKGSLAAAVV